MHLLIDEMHSPTVAVSLRADGIDAISVAAETSLRGMSDAELFDFALNEGRAIVTEDASDFAVLAAAKIGDGQTHCGVIFTSPQQFHRGAANYTGSVITALRNFLAAPPAESDTWIRWLT